MFAILSLLLVLALSLLITRVAAVALMHTGMSAQSARFQARSAFSGVGFTTDEAEQVVNHPVRRRIVAWLMLFGNVGLVTAISSLLLSASAIERGSGLHGVAVLVGGVAALLWFSSSAWVDRRMSWAISWALRHWTTIDARDYARLLHVREDYGISELQVEPGDWLDGKTLRQSRLAGEGVIVLGMECPGDYYLGAPGPDTPMRAGDVLVLYGRTPRIAELDHRTTGAAGDRAHSAARREREEIARREIAEAGRASVRTPAPDRVEQGARV